MAAVTLPGWDGYAVEIRDDGSMTLAPKETVTPCRACGGTSALEQIETDPSPTIVARFCCPLEAERVRAIYKDRTRLRVRAAESSES